MPSRTSFSGGAGAPVFADRRVPIRSMFDHLEAGDSFGHFLKGFPGVKPEQVRAVLEETHHQW